MRSLKKTKELPLTIWLKNTNVPLFTQKILRSVVNKRWVITAYWGERRVVAKVFTKFHHAQRELKGVQALQAAGVITPGLLYHGWAAHIPLYVLIFEEVMQAVDVDIAWWQGDDKQRAELFKQLVTTAAQLHSAGLKQKDLHLQNFLLNNQSQLFVIDGSTIVKTTNKQALSENAGLKNLGLLFAQIAPSYDENCETWYRLYCKERHIIYTLKGLQCLKKWICYWRQKHFRILGKKVFRSTSRLIRQRFWNKLILCDRDYYQEKMQKFLMDPEKMLQDPQTKILKAGNTCTVLQVNIDGRQFVVKRYNIKNFWHGLNRAFRSSRAAFYWRNAQCLASWRLGVAKPIALLENRFGLLRRQAYYIMEPVSGMSLQQLIANSNPADENLIKQKTSQLFSMLENMQLTHGDLKADNIIFVGDEPVLLDLDAMRLHRFNWLWQRAHSRDLKRFKANWEGSRLDPIYHS